MTFSTWNQNKVSDWFSNTNAYYLHLLVSLIIVCLKLFHIHFQVSFFFPKHFNAGTSNLGLFLFLLVFVNNTIVIIPHGLLPNASYHQTPKKTRYEWNKNYIQSLGWFCQLFHAFIIIFIIGSIVIIMFTITGVMNENLRLESVEQST